MTRTKIVVLIRLIGVFFGRRSFIYSSIDRKALILISTINPKNYDYVAVIGFRRGE